VALDRLEGAAQHGPAHRRRRGREHAAEPDLQTGAGVAEQTPAQSTGDALDLGEFRQVDLLAGD